VKYLWVHWNPCPRKAFEGDLFSTRRKFNVFKKIFKPNKSMLNDELIKKNRMLVEMKFKNTI
jgi:hypothetical protein